MGKLISNSILILIVLTSQLNNSMVTLVYQTNYDYYVNVLCENQDKPEKHCDGKCYFAKQLALTDDTHNKTEPPVLLPTLRLFSIATVDKPVAFLLPESTSPISTIEYLRLQEPFYGSIEHPPQV